MDPQVSNTESNQTMWYIVGAALIIVLGLAWWMFMGSAATGGPAAVENSQQASTTSPTSGQPTSLRNLFAAGISQKCTFSETIENSQSSGTVYIANGMMRGDFTSVASGQTIESHMIVKDNTSYLWSSAMPQGIKMSFDAMSGQGAPQQGAPQGLDLNAQTNYSCAPWSVDQGQFALPTNVRFQDMSALVPTTGR